MHLSYLLGLDCGLTNVKAAIFSLDGRKISEASASTPVYGFNIDTVLLRERAFAVVRQAVETAQINADHILAVGLSGHGNGLYAMDEAGAVVEAMTPMFHENREAVDAFGRSEAYERFYELTNQSCWGGQPMQILAWLKKERPAQYARVRTIVMNKDYIRYCLTGNISTEYTDLDASALLPHDPGVHAGELFALSGVYEKVGSIPEPGHCYAAGGRISAETAVQTGLPEGIPVACGAIDICACMLGAGVTAPGRYSITAGTWAITASVLEKEVKARQLTQVSAFADGFHKMAIVSAPTSCVNLEWFISAIRPGLTYTEANAIAAGFRPDEVNALFLPYLYQDMAMPDVPCGWIGLKPGDTWREMLRAVYEGVAFAHRFQLDRMREAGIHSQCAMLSGGAAASDVWCQLFADVLQIQIDTASEKQVGALGAAMMAAVCAGVYPSLSDAAGRMVRKDRHYEPSKAFLYQRKYENFKRMVKASLWTSV